MELQSGGSSGSTVTVAPLLSKTCDALREWLRIQGLLTRGKKAELIERYKNSLAN